MSVNNITLLLRLSRIEKKVNAFNPVMGVVLAISNKHSELHVYNALLRL